MKKLVVILLCLSRSCWGAIALDSSTGLLVNVGSSSVSVSFTNTAGTYMVVCFAASAAASHGPFSASYNSVSMTRQIDTNNVSGVSDAVIFTLVNPATGSNTLSITWDGVAINHIVNAYTLTGVGTFDTTGTDITGSTQITINMTTAVNNEWIIDCAFNNNSNAMTAGASQINTLGGNNTAGATDCWSSTKLVNSGSNSVDWTASAFSQPAYSAIALEPAATGGGGLCKMKTLESRTD